MGLAQELNMQRGDKALMWAYAGGGLASLAGAGALALILVLIRAPVFGISGSGLYYKILSAHAMAGFVYWFAFIQAALLIAGGTALMNGQRLWSLKLGWVAFGFTAAGLTTSMIGVFSGASVLYTAFPPLSGQLPFTPIVYLGYTFAAVGALLISINFLVTVFSAVENRGSFTSWLMLLRDMHVSTFAAVCAVVLIIPVTIVAFFLFIPSLMWSAGWLAKDAMEFPMDYRMTYMMLFHVVHYIPAMAMIAVAYVLVELTTGATSVYSKTVAKALFLLYPAVVPPTFLYHLLVDPAIPENIKIVGSGLSLLIGVPSILHMFIIMGMMESRMRSAGHGPLSWIRHLPWGNPAFGSMLMGMITFGVAGSLSYVLLQEQASQLLHNTFAVPAYIHPMVVGAASLIYMGSVYYGITLFAGRDIWGLAAARFQPYLLSGALLIFAIFGSLAGYGGAPRRTSDVAYGGAAPESWSGLMNVALGIGGLLAIAAGILFMTVIGMSVLAGRKLPLRISQGLTAPEPVMRQEYKRTPVSLVPGGLFISVVLVLTVVAFGIMRGWPMVFG